MTAASAEDFNCFLENISLFLYFVFVETCCMVLFDLCYFDTVTVRNVKHLSQNYEMESKKIEGATKTIASKYI